MRGFAAFLLWLLAGSSVPAPAGAVSGARDLVELSTAHALIREPGAGPEQRPSTAMLAAAPVVALPDNWKRTRTPVPTVVWYLLPLDAALATLDARTAPRGLALLIPRVAERGRFWLNDAPLNLVATGASTRNRALLLPLPADHWRAAGNQLLVQVEGHPDSRDGLSALLLGRADALQLPFALRQLFQSVAPLLLTVLVASAVFAALPLWWKTRQRSHGLFLLIALCWLPRSLAVLRPDAGAPGMWMLAFVLLTSLCSTALIAVLTLDDLGLRARFWSRYRRLLGLVVLAGGAGGIALAATAQLRPPAFVLILLVLFLTLIPGLLAQLRSAFLSPQPIRIFMAMALTLWTAASLHDLAQVADLTAFDSFFLAPSAGLLVLLALIWRTIADLALRRASAQLEVAAALATAHAHFEQDKVAQRAAVITAERARLLSDLHDGLGGQLITALRMARRPEVPREDLARVIESALEDMRLIIDSLDLEERDLLTLLGSLRMRLEPRLAALGIALCWEVEPLPELDYLTPETGLAILRIVQEALGNALRHSAATTLVVSASVRDPHIVLEIRDNGRGFDAAAAPLGRGLATMRARAARLGAQWDIDSQPGATRVRLRLPLVRPPYGPS